MKLRINYSLATIIQIHENKCCMTFDFCDNKAVGQLQTQAITGLGNYRLIGRLFVLAVYDYIS